MSSSNSEEIAESMEIDDDEGSVSEVGKSFSVPSFLRKVFTEELGDYDEHNHKLLVIAVRAVLLESGFVEIDPVSNLLKSNKFDVQGNWYLTLPNIITGGNIETVKIMFQSNPGQYRIVYGSLVNGTGSHLVFLDEDRHLCEKAGFQLPPCFMRLPAELKLKVLESVSGVDIVKVSCVCSELRYLASSDDLWKQKYIEQFGNAAGSDGGRTCKERFSKTWEGRKRRKIAAKTQDTSRWILPYPPPYPYPPLIAIIISLSSIGSLSSIWLSANRWIS